MHHIFTCPHCHQDLTATPDMVGLHRACPHCEGNFIVPTADQAKAEIVESPDSATATAEQPVLDMPGMLQLAMSTLPTAGGEIKPQTPGADLSTSSPAGWPPSLRHRQAGAVATSAKPTDQSLAQSSHARPKWLAWAVGGAAAVIVLLLGVIALLFSSLSARHDPSPSRSFVASHNDSSSKARDAAETKAREQRAEAEEQSRQRAQAAQQQAEAEAARQARAAADKAEIERKRLAAEAEERQAKRLALINQINDVTRSINDLEDTATAIKDRYEENDSLVTSYMMDHKMAIAAILAGVGGFKTALDHNSEFSKEARQISGIIGAAATFWALGNMREVMDVGSYMVNANSVQTSLKSRLATATSNLQKYKSRKASLESELDGLAR